MAFFILTTHYPSGRTWANILLFVWLCVYSIKTGIWRIMRPDELRFVVRRSRRISKESSSRRIMRLMPVFILKTHNQMNYKCLPKLVKTNNAFSSIKTDNKEATCILHAHTWTKTFNVQKSTKPLNFSPSPRMARNLLRETPQRKPKAERGQTSSFQPRYFHSGENKTIKHTKDLNELLAQVTNNLNYYFITWLA